MSEILIFYTHTCQNLPLSPSFLHCVLWNKSLDYRGSIVKLLQRPYWWWGMAELYQGEDGAELGPYRRRGKCFSTENERGTDAFLEHRTAHFIHPQNLVTLQRWWRTRSSALLCLAPLPISVCDTATLFRCHSLERCLLSLRLKHSWALPRIVKTWRGRYMLWAWWVWLCSVWEHKELGAKPVTAYLL